MNGGKASYILNLNIDVNELLF